jgi:hypothetical protein
MENLLAWPLKNTKFFLNSELNRQSSILIFQSKPILILHRWYYKNPNLGKELKIMTRNLDKNWMLELEFNNFKNQKKR